MDALAKLLGSDLHDSFIFSTNINGDLFDCVMGGHKGYYEMSF